MALKIEDLDCKPQIIAGALPAWQAEVDAAQWRSICKSVREQHGRLIALWGSDRREADGQFAIHAALVIESGLLWLTLPVDDTYPGIAEHFPAADRMQRAVADLLGIAADDQPEAQRWLRHGAWPADRYPLRKDFGIDDSSTLEPDDFRFVRVEGDGVHEIPVGPVHAGTIEPGHFRFSIVGERVLRLEERLGYKHKAIEKRFETMTLDDGARLAGRISGDSTVAYAWAYAMAVEGAADVVPPERASWLRALLLERERLAAHVWDLGFLGNDAGFAFGLAQFSRLKEDMLRVNASMFGHRMLMDAIVPGGVARDIGESDITRLRHELSTLSDGITRLQAIYDDHPGLQDRLLSTGVVTPELAERLGLTGLAGRASGQLNDQRVQFPVAPYGKLAVVIQGQRRGDVAARMTVRFDEAMESLRLCGEILDQIPDGAILKPVPDALAGASGIGWIEGWRGDILIALETAADNRIGRLHAHDPSWQNWPVLEHAVLGNIVPDFPLINKSFNLSYSGHDL